MSASKSSNGTEESVFAGRWCRATWKLAQQDLVFVFGCLFWTYGQKIVEIARAFPQKNCERSFLGHPFLNSAALVALNRGMALS